MTIEARDAPVSVHGSAPLRTGFTGVLLMATPADFRLLQPAEVLETPDQSGRLALGFHVLAARAVAGFTGLPLPDPVMDVLRERLDQRFVAAGTFVVIVDVLGSRDLWQLGPQGRQRGFLESLVGLRPAGTQVRIQPPAFRDRKPAGGNRQTRSREQHQPETGSSAPPSAGAGHAPRRESQGMQGIRIACHRFCPSASPPCGSACPRQTHVIPVSTARDGILDAVPSDYQPC